MEYKKSHPSSISLPQLTTSTPTKLMRKLSHSKLLHNSKSFRKDFILPENCSGKELLEDGSPLEFEANIKVKDLPTRLRGLPCGKYFGLILALLASITISLTNLVVKSMSGYHAFSLVLWRLQGVAVPSAILLGVLKCGPRGAKGLEKKGGGNGIAWKLLLLLFARGFFGCSADVFQYCSLKYLSLADSSVIAFSTPIFVSFVAYFVLGEKLGLIPVLTGLLSLVGVIIISRPPLLTGAEAFDTDILIGNALALGCMVMATLTFIVLRLLRTSHFSVTTFSFGFVGSLEVLGLCAAVGIWELPSGAKDWSLAASIAATYFIGQVFFTLALQLEDAGPVALIRSCDVIFAYLWQYLFLDVVPDVFSIVGGSIVVLGVIITAARKFVEELPSEDKNRRRFSFLLR